MSDLSNEIINSSPKRACECYKKLETYGIPLYISEENDFYAESKKKITYENAFQFPGILEINGNITEYLTEENNDLFNIFHHMAQVIPKLSDFEQNMLHFWIMDMFIEGLRTSQKANMNFNHQKATLLWIAYLFNYIYQHNPTRQGLFNHLKKVIFKYEYEKGGEEFLGESNQKMSESEESEQKSFRSDELHWTLSRDKKTSQKTLKSQESQMEELENSNEGVIWDLPMPPEIYIMKDNDLQCENGIFCEENISTEPESRETTRNCPSLTSIKKDSTENITETNLVHTKIIMEILYRIFARLWVFLEIQTVIEAMPTSIQVDLPYKLGIPKHLLIPETISSIKEKNGKRHSFSETSYGESTGSEKEMHKNDFLLPLQVAEESKLLMKQLFPVSGSQRSTLGRKKS